MIKKLLLLGFGLVLLIGLPLTIFILQNQTQPVTKAAPVTKFSFNAPAQVSVGQAFDVPLVVDPGGTNQVSFVKFAFTYDPAKLDKAATPVTIDTALYSILEAPAVTCTDALCTVTATISVGNNQNAIIKTTATIATIHFIAKANTETGAPTQLAFVSGQNQALSTNLTADQAAENVFLSGIPASIVIGASGTAGGSTPTDTPTLSPTDTPAIAAATPTGVSGTTGTGGTTSLAVSCDSFTADKNSGTSPLIVTFTTVGSSTNDSITTIALNYGDSAVDQIASGSGIGTGNINNQTSHTYSANGVYTATATLTTAGGATNDPSACKQTITVGTASASPTALVQGNKLPPTGPGQTILLIGLAGMALSILGIFVIAGL